MIISYLPNFTSASSPTRGARNNDKDLVVLVVMFVVFVILSKWYTLRERNREINIQAIVEEHYERYMDQEEEYSKLTDSLIMVK